MNKFNELCEQIIHEKNEKETIAKSVQEIQGRYGVEASSALVNLLKTVDRYSKRMKAFRESKFGKKPTLPKPIIESDYRKPEALAKAKEQYKNKVDEYEKNLKIHHQMYKQINQEKLDDLYKIYETAKDLKVPNKDECQLEYVIGNSKVGDDTIIINMGPATICDAAKAGQCDLYTAGFCYAQNNETQHKLALVKRFKQKLQWKTLDASGIATMLASVITEKRKSGKNIQFIRFNESGDLSDASDKDRLGKVVNETNRILREGKEPKVTFYTYTHRSDLFANGVNDIPAPDLVIQGSHKYGKTDMPFFVDNCFMGIDYDEAKRVIAEGKTDDYAELKSILNFPPTEKFPSVVFCRGACLGCDWCKTKSRKLILVVYHGSGTKIKSVSSEITRDIKELFNKNAKKTLKAMDLPSELRQEIIASNYYHENGALEKLLPFTRYTWSAKKKAWQPPMLEIDSLYDFIMHLRANIAEAEAKNPNRMKSSRYYTQFKDPVTGERDGDGSKLKAFLEQERANIAKSEADYQAWMKTGKIASLSSSDEVTESLDLNKKLNFDQTSMQTMSNLSVANLLRNIKGFVTESVMESETTASPMPTDELLKASYQVQKKMQKILKEKMK